MNRAFISGKISLALIVILGLTAAGGLQASRPRHGSGQVKEDNFRLKIRAYNASHWNSAKKRMSRSHGLRFVLNLKKGVVMTKRPVILLEKKDYSFQPIKSGISFLDKPPYRSFRLALKNHRAAYRPFQFSIRFTIKDAKGRLQEVQRSYSVKSAKGRSPYEYRLKIQLQK